LLSCKNPKKPGAVKLTDKGQMIADIGKRELKLCDYAADQKGTWKPGDKVCLFLYLLLFIFSFILGDKNRKTQCSLP
jgi:hypothetical protein